MVCIDLEDKISTPPGLQQLASVDKLLVEQQVEFLGVFFGFEKNNKYKIKNNFGHAIYWAVEINDARNHSRFGSSRPFEIAILDSFQNKVISLERPVACCAAGSPQRLKVCSPPLSAIGSVEQEDSKSANFQIKNSAGNTIMTMKGPPNTFSISGDVDFVVSIKTIIIHIYTIFYF